MPLTPLDIHNKEFRRGFRGYSEVEVDEFLDEIVKEVEDLQRENKQLTESITELDDKVGQYRALEETLRDTLIVAQRTAEEVKESARKEAELIVREAELKAQAMLDDARERCRRLGDEHDELKRQIYILRARLQGMVKAHLDLIDQQIADVESDHPDQRDSSDDPSGDDSTFVVKD